LALEKGLDNLTVEAISEAADVSPRTFFNYFPSKEDALVTDAARIGDELRPLILERPAGESPMQVLRAVFIEHDPFALVHANRERAVARQRLLQEHPTLIARQWRSTHCWNAPSPRRSPSGTASTRPRIFGRPCSRGLWAALSGQRSDAGPGAARTRCSI